MLSLSSPMMRLLCFIALFTLVCTSACFALPLRVLAWDDAIAARKLAVVSGATLAEIKDMHPLKRTAVMRIKEEGPLAIRATDKAPSPEGKPQERAIIIGAAIKAPLLLILPDKEHPTGIRLLVIDDDPAGFSWGSYRFINATPKELVVQMEKIAKRIPADWKPVDINLGGDTRGVGARISLAEKIEEPLYSAVWEYQTESRTLCFLVPGSDARTSPIDFKAIPEDQLTHKLQAEEPK